MTRHADAPPVTAPAVVPRAPVSRRAATHR